MTQDQSTILESDPDGARRTDRDHQRAALRDLVALSAECTTVERQVEQDRLADVQGEQRKYQKLVADLEERYKSDTAQARLAHAERVAKIRGQFDEDFNSLKLWDQVARDK